MTYLEVHHMRKQAKEEGKTLKSLYRASPLGQEDLKRISGGEYAWAVAGALLGSGGGYLLSKLLHKNPSTATKILYTLGGATAGALTPNAIMTSRMSGDKGAGTVRDNMRLEAGWANLSEKTKDDIRTFQKKLKRQQERQSHVLPKGERSSWWNPYRIKDFYNDTTDGKLESLYRFTVPTAIGVGGGALVDAGVNYNKTLKYNRATEAYNDGYRIRKPLKPAKTHLRKPLKPAKTHLGKGVGGILGVIAGLWNEHRRLHVDKVMPDPSTVKFTRK